MFSMRNYILVILLFCARAASAQDTAANFKKQCSLCHGADGHATVPMGKTMGAIDLTSVAVQKTPDPDLKIIITKGKGRMPAYGSALGPKGVDDMLKYVRGLAKK
jgi:mono/diheme cytochrome c family protein